jgi:hypothetical protein
MANSSENKKESSVSIYVRNILMSGTNVRFSKKKKKSAPLRKFG